MVFIGEHQIPATVGQPKIPPHVQQVIHSDILLYALPGLSKTTKSG
jgi:hypothetical protein